jgi:hypothetical protein
VGMMKLDVPHFTACCGIPLHAPVRCVSRPNTLITIEVSHMFIIPNTGVQRNGQGTGGSVWVKYFGGGSETAGGRCGGATHGAAFRVRSVRNVIQK